MTIVNTLLLLKSKADEGTYPADHIREDLAKAWANGENNVEMRTLKPGESHTFAEKVEGEMAGRGMGVERAVRALESCLACLRQLDIQLQTVPTKEEAAEIWDTYDTVGERPQIL